MSHVHGWLVVLSFVLGVVATTALMVRPVQSKTQRKPRAAKGVKAVKEPPTEKILVPRPGAEPPTLKIPPAKRAKEPATQKVPSASAANRPPRKVPVAKKAAPNAPERPAQRGAEHPTRKIRVVKKVPAKKVPPRKAPPRKVPPASMSSGTDELAQEAKKGPFAPFGPGSARAAEDGGGPSGWSVKGRSDTRLYYTPEDLPYDEIAAQVWFKDEVSASRAFFTAWRKSARR